MSDTQPSLLQITEEPQFDEVALEALSANNEMNNPLPSPSFLATVKDAGVIVPIVVRDRGNGSYDVIDGARRVAAARLLAKKTTEDERVRLRLDPMQAIVYPPAFSAKEVLTIILNAQRSENVVRDFVAIENLMKVPGMTEERISHELHLDLPMVRQRIRLTKLKPQLRDAFLEGKLKPGHAEKVAKWPEDKQQQVCAVLSEHGKVTGKDLDAITSKKAADAIGELPLGELQTGNLPDVPTPSDGLLDIGGTWRDGVKKVASALRTVKKSQVTSAMMVGWAEELEKCLTS